LGATWINTNPAGAGIDFDFFIEITGMTNREVRRLFIMYAELLHLHEQGERLSDFLQGAAYRIGRMSEPVLELNKDELAPLFKPVIVSAVLELKAKGAIDALEELIQLTPSGLFDMMRIKGLGGKKLAVLWKTAKIDTVEDLLKACKNNRIAKVPGFGTKTEQNIIEAIEAFNNNSERFHYADVAESATGIEKQLQDLFKTKQISLTGEVRRQATTVVGIEIMAAISPKGMNTPGLRKIMTISNAKSNVTNGHSLDEIPITIYHCAPQDFARCLFEQTGNEAHINKVLKKIKKVPRAASEEAIYQAAGMAFIPPEMRENVAEWEYNTKSSPLIALEHIKGVVHNHTTWSDGVDSLEDFVAACKKKGYEYVVISDHSQNAHYAGGLKAEQVLLQFDAIEKLNKKLAPFKIFKSIECDILISGELDYDKSLLKQFDMVIVSVHQQLKMPEDKATARLIKAIENPYTTILGHMTGRQLLIRPGYPVNFKKVIDACAANGVVIEINANPYRLDMDWSHIPYAMKKGVPISINPDAHSVYEIDNIRWGVSAARKGGLTKRMTWNAMSLNEILQWLELRK
jgi:DNA polymerase (family 10)